MCLAANKIRLEKINDFKWYIIDSQYKNIATSCSVIEPYEELSMNRLMLLFLFSFHDQSTL